MTEEAFVGEYLRNGFSGTGAWMFTHPGCKPTTAATEAHKCLRKPKVAARIHAARQRMAEKFEMDRDKVLSEWMALYTADVNELMQIRTVACEACYGGERGPGRYVDADPDCEVCAGEGIKVPWLADTRNLSPQGKRLYAGYKITRDGIQILTHDKARALENIGRILGVYEADNSQKGQALADAVRAFFSGIHGSRLPIARPASKAIEQAPSGHPLVREGGS